jgi:hypothetical protein
MKSRHPFATPSSFTKAALLLASFAVLALAAFGAPVPAAADCPMCPTTTLQVAVLIDASGSMDASEFLMQLQGVAGAVNNTPPDGTVEITVIQYGSNVSVEVPPTVIDSTATRTAVANDILAIVKGGGSTNMAGAINTARTQLTGSPRFECAAWQAINLSTDGFPDDQGGRPRRATTPSPPGSTSWTSRAWGMEST